MILEKSYGLEVTLITISTSLILLMVSIASQFRVYIEAVARGALEVKAIFPIMFYLLPQFLGLILPIGFYIGVVMVLMRTLHNNELIVLRSSGMSELHFGRKLLLPTLIVTFLCFMLQLFFIPTGLTKVAHITANNNNLDAFDFLTPKRFTEINNSTKIYVESFEKENTMEQVFLYTFDNNQTTSIFGKTASLNKQEDNRYIRLNDGYSYNVASDTAQATEINFHSADIDITTKIPILTINKLDALPTSELLVSTDPKKVSLLWWRISLSILAPILFFCLVATQSISPRRSNGFRLLGIFGICISYIAGLFSMQSIADTGVIHPALLYMFVPMLFIISSIIWKKIHQN